MTTNAEALNCSVCGLPTVVTDSRPHTLGIKRNRRCSNGHRFPTLEVRAHVAGRTAEPDEMPSFQQARQLFMQH